MNHINVRGVPTYGCRGVELESHEREPFSRPKCPKYLVHKHLGQQIFYVISPCAPLGGCYNDSMNTRIGFDHVLETIAAILIVLLAFI